MKKLLWLRGVQIGQLLVYQLRSTMNTTDPRIDFAFFIEFNIVTSKCLFLAKSN